MIFLNPRVCNTEFGEAENENKQKVSSDKFTMMTQMPVNKLICKMAVPTIITMLVSAVYNMADTYLSGK